MKRTAALLLALALGACAKKPAMEPAKKPANDTAKETVPAVPPQSRNARPLRDVTFERTTERLARGKTLTEGLLQCFVCHSDRDWTKPGAPPVEALKGAGHLWWTDGETRLVAPNLTPDVETGAGSWTDDMLARAIREGVGHDGRPLHPQMWYTSFRNLSDEDLASVVVAIRALPPVKRKLPQTRLKAGRYAKIMENPENAAIIKPVPAPDRADRVAYGKYLVRIADCQGCHTAWEAPLNPGQFGGGNHIERESGAGNEKIAVFSRNITPDPSGIPYYDDALFIETMRTGKVRARELSPLMPWVVFKNLPDDELIAMHAYLKTVPPVRHVVDKAEAETDCPMCGQKHGGGGFNKAKGAHAIPIDPKAVTGLEGSYRFEDGFVLSLRQEKGKWLAGEQGKPGAELLTDDNVRFFILTDVGLFEPQRDASGRITGLIDRGLGDITAVKLP